MANIKILISDFDGVICDSIKECFIVAYNAYLRINLKEGSGCIRLIAPRSLRRYFLINRYLVGPAREYFILFKSFDLRKDKVLSIGRFKLLRKRYEQDCTNFEDEFYKTRRYLQDRYREKWFRLQRMYPGAIESVKRLRKRFKFYISTTKDKKSVKKLLSNHGMRISDKFVFSKESNLSKMEAAKRILRVNNCMPSDIWVIEDNIIYLNELSKLKINCCFAKWGYISKDALRLANEERYIIFDKFRNAAEYLLRNGGDI